MEKSIELIEKKLKNIENKILFVSFFVSIFLMIIFIVIKYPDWLEWIDVSYYSPNSFIQLLYLYTLFIISAFISVIHHLDKNIKIKERTIWILASAGFLFLTLDEKYKFHNQLRDYLKVNKKFLWFENGDFVLFGVLVAGLIFSFFFVKYLIQSKRAFILFSLGIVVTIFSVVIDSIHLHKVLNVTRDLFWGLEEISETIAMTFFINSFVSMFCFYLKNFLNNISTSEEISEKIPE